MASKDFKLEKDMPLKDMIKGLEPMMPVGARGFTLIEADGKDEAGEPKFKMTDLSAIQDEIHKEAPNWDWDKNCYKPSEE
mmetsp:Transcript_26435/g.33001  ORF Transcript_26435/g.33001 Transcript_26435/m.33001 type:complete len:80 (-) Transcript_26435:498-737(-)